MRYVREILSIRFAFANNSMPDKVKTSYSFHKKTAFSGGFSFVSHNIICAFFDLKKSDVA